MLKNVFFVGLLCACFAARADFAFESARALVVDEESGQVLFQKNATTAAPIASMTKLMTAMVVLDAGLPSDEVVRITRDDLDTLKHTTSGVPVGALIQRGDLLLLALMSSDNHAAAALARTFPGGHAGFQEAARRKIEALQLEDTVIDEPTGLSPHNRATAHDMVRILKAASAYPEIESATSRAQQTIHVSGRPQLFRNTNALVGRPGWDIMVSKTGFTREAGRCLTMRLTAAGRRILIVLMGAIDSWERTIDAHNIQRWLGVPLPDLAIPKARTRMPALRHVRHVGARKRR
jgi:serine-type D-Ala-D-Ala endopeptidase (penicillin-binding protein 7)